MRLFILLFSLLSVFSFVFSASYQNPVWSEDFADPFILLVDNSYLAYSTNSGSMNIPVLRSPSSSFSDWTLVGDALPSLPPWAQANAGLTWAPSVFMYDETHFVMYYTARYTQTGKQCVSYATSSSPTGPFVDPNLNAPWLCQLSIGGSIDASPFVDPKSNNVYLIWKNDGNCCGNKVNIWAQQLNSNGTQFLGQPVALITNDQPWEGNLVEGPSMVYYNDNGISNYYLFYSANDYASYLYAVGYAVCSTPLGPCNKPSYSPIIALYSNVWGPGGEQPFYDPLGKLWFCYHGWTAPNTSYPDGARSLRIDRLNFVNGIPFIADHVPTTRPVYYAVG